MTLHLKATVGSDEAAATRWDVLVIGAGPAGASAAITLARQGLAVLLIDRQRFPRAKVCGCCVNVSALRVLEMLGVRRRIDELGAQPIESIALWAGGRCARLPLDGGVSLSRSSLDALLAQAAIDAGAQFMDAALARSTHCEGDYRSVWVTRGGARFEIKASIVLVASGLAASLDGVANAAATRDSLMGAAAIVADGERQVENHVIQMACGSGGYVGTVRIEDGLMDVGAALKPAFVRECGGPGAAAARLMEEAGAPFTSHIQHGLWKGTPLLTRRASSVAQPRLLVVGDAAGYVEPFTGEGIAWALASGVAAAGCAERAVNGRCVTLERDWPRLHRQLLSWRQRRCVWLTRLLRYPALVRTAVAVLSRAPGLARPVVRGFSHSGFRVSSCRSASA